MKIISVSFDRDIEYKEYEDRKFHTTHELNITIVTDNGVKRARVDAGFKWDVCDMSSTFSGNSSWVGDAYGLFDWVKSGGTCIVDSHTATFKDCTSAIGYANIPGDWK